MNHAVFELFPCLLRAKQSKDQGNGPDGTLGSYTDFTFTWFNVHEL